MGARHSQHSTTKAKIISVNGNELNQIIPNLKHCQDSAPTISLEKAFAHLVEGQNVLLECYGEDKNKLVVHLTPLTNQFIATVHLSFQYHYPIIFSPDHISILVAQGLSQHINQDPESVRKVFVSHEGKKTIRVVLPDEFSPGNPDNDWGSITNIFSSAIREHIGDSTHKLIVNDFSTTTPVERVVSEMVLMEAMKSYFKYEVISDCGIPAIQLEGTVQDWETIVEKVHKIQRLLPDLQWWTDPLCHVLSEFVNLKKGKLNQEFWTSFYKWSSGSGSDSVSGYVNAFFPYLQNLFDKIIKRNLELAPKEYDIREYMTPSTDSFPHGFSCAPFVWLPMELKMVMIGGFVGCTQAPKTKALRPTLSWAVGQDKTAT